MTLAQFDRDSSLHQLQHTSFDTIVIGGGITGAGVAIDAASRGLRTALIERDDFAFGTSSKSSKMVHGGLRYLQQGEIGLVYEALAERQRLLTNAPHLVHELPFLLPMFGKGGVLPAKISRILGLAMWGYDLTGGLRIGKLHRRVTKEQALSYFPTLRSDVLASGYLYFDAGADDARLVTALCRTAALHHGAVIANRVSAIGMTHDSAGDVTGVRVSTGTDEFVIEARTVVNASGVWSDEVQSLDDAGHQETIRPAKGIHISVPHHLIQNTIAAVIPVKGDRRSVFVVPQGDLTYIGTTDTDYEGSIDTPQCTPEDIDYLLGAINGYCTNTVTKEDIVGTWAGLRPLVKSASSGRTADLSRRHKVQRSASGVITISGGKLTTYRKMAADTTDEVVSMLGSSAPQGANKTRTKKLRFRGADGADSVVAAAEQYGVTAEIADHLANRYGGEARALMAMIKADPSLAEPLVARLPYVVAEAVFAVRHEMARSVDDVLSRRTRARLYGRDDSLDAAELVGQILIDELGYTTEQAAASVQEYHDLCEAERLAAGLPHVHLNEVLGTSS